MPSASTGLSLLGREVAPGTSVAIVGPSRSGRSTQLRVWASEASSTVVSASRAWGKLRPQDLGRRGKNGATRLAEALDATGLWDERANAISALGLSGALLAEFAALAIGDDPALFIDDLFDRLDPWRRAAVRDHLVREATLVLTTHALDLAGSCDLVAVMAGRRPIFFGAPEELIAAQPIQSFEVETGRGGAVAALVAPLAVDVTQTEGRVTFRAREGQETIVRLLLAGYGDVRSFVTRTPTFAQAVGALLGRAT